MTARVVASPFTWYQKNAVCNRRKTCTTIICLLSVTTFFSYLACNKYARRIRLTVENPSLDAVNSEGFTDSTRSPEGVVSPWIRGDSSDVNKFNKSALKLGLSTRESRKSQQRSSSKVLSTTNSEGLELAKDLTPTFDQRPDLNSIEGRLSLDRQIYSEDVTNNYSAVDIIPFDGEEGTDGPPSGHRTDPYKGLQLTDSVTQQTILVDGIPTTAVLKSTSPTPPSENTMHTYATLFINSSANYDYKDYFEEIQYDSESDISSWDSDGMRPSSNVTQLSSQKDTIYEKRQNLNILNTKPFHFLDTYKNPCWIEEQVETWYMDNFYLDVENVRNVLTRMSAILRLRQERGDYHRLRCLPYFFIIGQPKCGSTDLYEKLLSHPEALRPPTKEPHWWSRARLGRFRSAGHFLSIEDYTDVFDYTAYNIEQHPIVSPDTGRVYHRMITGEGSMSTFWDNDNWSAMVGNQNLTEPRILIPDYIRHLLPDIKLILILRDPTTRMYSDYLYFAKKSKTPTDFHADVVSGIKIFENCTRLMTLRNCVYNRTVNMLTKIRLRVGLYAVFLEDWFKVFPREQFFIIRTETYAVRPRNVLNDLFSFLGLKSLSETHVDRILSKQKANTRRAKDKVVGDMLPETRVLLNNFYRPMNEKLAELLKDKGYLWQDVK